MDIDSILTYLDDLSDDIAEIIGRKILGNDKYNKMQAKKREHRNKVLAKSREKTEKKAAKLTAKIEEERKKQEIRNQIFAKSMQKGYRELGIDVQLEDKSLLEMLDEMEKADEILRKEDEDFFKEIEEMYDD